jgi:hypothetical protein
LVTFEAESPLRRSLGCARIGVVVNLVKKLSESFGLDRKIAHARTCERE